MYEIFAKLLEKRGITPYRVHKDTGISQTTLSDWKNGKITPKADKMQKIADYFGVSLDYLMYGEEQKETPAKTASVDDEDIKFALSGGDGEITDAQYEEVKKFVQFIKERDRNDRK